MNRKMILMALALVFWLVPVKIVWAKYTDMDVWIELENTTGETVIHADTNGQVRRWGVAVVGIEMEKWKITNIRPVLFPVSLGETTVDNVRYRTVSPGGYGYLRFDVRAWPEGREVNYIIFGENSQGQKDWWRWTRSRESVIKTVSPAFVYAGQRVTIGGFGFEGEDRAFGRSVAFRREDATAMRVVQPETWSNTKITAIVPEINLGLWNLYVMYTDSRGERILSNFAKINIWNLNEKRKPALVPMPTLPPVGVWR